MQISFSHQASKQLKKAPFFVKTAVRAWTMLVLEIGLKATRELRGKGLHDEPLKGSLRGLRSIRLNKSWRLYYSIENSQLDILTVERIDKHKY